MAGSTAAVVPSPAAAPPRALVGGMVRPTERNSGVNRPATGQDRRDIASLVSEADTENEGQASEEVKAEIVAAFPFLEGELEDVVMIWTADDVARVSWTDPIQARSSPKSLQVAAEEIDETDAAVSPPGLGQSVGRGHGPAGQLLAWTRRQRNKGCRRRAQEDLRLLHHW